MRNRIMRGDIFYAYLDKGVGSEQYGHRPVLVIQNNVGNKFSPTVIVAAITGKVKEKTVVPTHISFEEPSILQLPSIVLTEQIATIDKTRLIHYLGHLGKREMQDVDKALAISIGL